MFTELDSADTSRAPPEFSATDVIPDLRKSSLEKRLYPDFFKPTFRMSKSEIVLRIYVSLTLWDFRKDSWNPGILAPLTFKLQITHFPKQFKVNLQWNCTEAWGWPSHAFKVSRFFSCLLGGNFHHFNSFQKVLEVFKEALTRAYSTYQSLIICGGLHFVPYFSGSL